MNSIQLWLARYILMNRQKNLIRKITTHNFNSASTIDILFNATDIQHFIHVKKFVDFLQKEHKKLRVLGYLHAKTIPQEMILINNFDFFCKKDLNLFTIPVTNTVLSFIDHHSDIFIDLTIERHFCLDYIRTLKKSDFRIGKYTTDSDKLEIMIDTGENNDLNYLFEQIIHYLRMIKSKEIISYEHNQV